MSKPLHLSETPRILVVRLSAVGDVIHAMPLANALRERFPKAFLTWVAANPAATLLQGHEALDELIVLGRRWLKSPREVLSLRRRLRALRFDVAIDAQGLTKSALAAWLSGARRRIGFGDYWGREISRWLHTDLVYTKTKHTVDRTLELIEPLGIVRPCVRFQVPLTGPERDAAVRTVREMGIEGPFAIINAGAGWPSKLWLPERFGAVAQHLGRQWQLPSIVVWAGQEERGLAERIVVASDARARPAPPTTLRELAALCQRAWIFVSSDTGPLHLAVAVGTPCVGLYGPWPAEENGPYGPEHVVVQKMAIYGTSSERRHASSALMDAIDVPSVCAACDEILGRRN
jgi:ADP-heptose:LPS heptosyltransferase